MIAQVTSGDSSGTRPIVEVLWDDSTSGVYDIVPTTQWDSGDAVQDTSNDVEVVTPADDTTDMCDELWYLTDIDVACVQFSGSLKRPRNTGDTTGDIILEYGSYAVHALIGRKDYTDTAADDSLRLAEQTIDFSVLASSDAVTAYTALSVSAVMALVSTMSF